MKMTIRISLLKDDVPSGASFACLCAELLLKIPVACTVIDTLSVVETDGAYSMEPGVIIDLYGTSKKIIETQVWPSLQRQFPSLECAHINDGTSFQGCIYDYLRPSACPENIRKAQFAAALALNNEGSMPVRSEVAVDLECGCVET